MTAPKGQALSSDQAEPRWGGSTHGNAASPHLQARLTEGQFGDSLWCAIRILDSAGRAAKSMGVIGME